MSIETEDTIQQDVSQDVEQHDYVEADADHGLDENDAEDAFLKNLRKDAEEPKEGEETDEETSEEAPAKADDEAPAAALASDDHEVEVKVGDATHKVKVADLKRLFGQEASLTTKSQEVAAAREEAVAHATRAKAIVEKAIEKAEANFAQYKDLDFWALSKRMDDESFAQLRKDAQAAHEHLTYLKGEAQAAHNTVAQVSQAAHRDAAQRAVAELTNPKSPNHIEGWGDAVYNDLMTFAEAKGLKSARSIVDPAVVKLLHMAHSYEKGRTLAATKVTKVAQQPTKPMRAGSSHSTPTPQRRDEDSALSRLKRSGSSDDAEAAFLARLRRAS